MTRIWLLFAFLALASGQIIYPDQYEMMTVDASQTSAAESLPTNYPSQVFNNSQPAQIDQQFKQEVVPQIGFAQAPPQTQPHSTTTHVPFYPSMSPTINPESSLENWNNHVNNIISRGIMKFSLDLDRAIHNAKGTSVTARYENVLFSPLSISVVLSLILLGSAGRTFDEVSRVLGLETGVDISQHSEMVHQLFGQLLANLNYRVEDSNTPRVNYASGIFVQEGYPIRSEFRAICENIYKSEVLNLDFQRKGKEAQDIINNWVKQRTMGKINGILNEVPHPMTAVILLSALYFKGEWNQHFFEGMTKRKSFFVEPNDEIEVDMMYIGGPFNFYEDRSLGVKIIALPYKGLEMSMYVLLPKAEGATALHNFRDQLTTDIIENLISNLKNETCVIGIPRMKLSSTLSLTNALQSLGLHSLFNAVNADLSIVSNGYGQGQDSASAIPQILQTLPPILPQPIPLILPQMVAQTAPRQAPSAPLASKTNEFLIFTRTGENDNQENNNQENNNRVTNGTQRNYFKYNDKKRGVSVEQWSTGFHIRKIRRTQRDILDRRTIWNHKKVALKSNDKSTKYMNSEENKYRFGDAKKNTKSRSRRQSRPIDENFLRFMQSKGFPSYGLDILRNSGNLVNPGLFASDVLHKVEMDVTEKGTEAAAATAVTLRRDGNQKRLIANRPFLFFIRHDPTKLILFWGTINAPTPNYAVVR